LEKKKENREWREHSALKKKKKERGKIEMNEKTIQPLFVLLCKPVFFNLTGSLLKPNWPRLFPP